MIKRKPAAFTLVEMLVVISIIGILMAIITPATQQALEMSRNTACRTKFANSRLQAPATAWIRASTRAMYPTSA